LDARRLAGALALVALACGTGTITGPGGSTGGPPPGSNNHDPVVTVPPAPTATPIAENGTTLLSVTAQDPDGDSLGYAWTQISPAAPQGTFSARTIRNPVWTAPAVTADTVFTFQVTITDGQGGSASQTCQVTVTHQVVNRAPVVSASIAVSPAAPVAGETVTLSITASDPDNDPLTITWVQTSPVTQGTFGSPTSTATTWFSPPFGVDSVDFAIQVTVSDGHNPSVTRQVTLTVSTPSYASDVQALWTAKCVSCHGGGTPDGQLTLEAGSSRAALVDQNMVASCTNAKRVVAGDPGSSGLINKLLGTSCGTRMPENASALSAGELALIQSWILRGALDN
jgi:hypothetical protein